ncbi:hypothetical protein ACFL0V_04090 [Nanoarchaeota archaeon]
MRLNKINKGIACLECVKNNSTCCTGSCTRFATLHDAVRLAKATGKKIDDIVAFLPVESWETNPRYAQQRVGNKAIMCDYFVLIRKGKLLMLKKGKDCIFLGKGNLCEAYRGELMFCKVFPFWYFMDRGKIQLAFDPCGVDCPAAKGNRDRNREILRGRDRITDEDTRLIGQSAKELKERFARYREEMKAYEGYVDRLEKGEKPGDIAKDLGLI